MLVSINDLLNAAKKQHCAIPQFNINNLEWTKIILVTMNELQQPVILGVSEGAIKYMGGYNTVVNLVKGLIKDQSIVIPVVLHLDHGSSLESCVKAVNSGFSSVMIDASSLEINKNIAITKQVVEYAHNKDVSVEAELGHVGGIEDTVTNNNVYTNVDEAIRYVKETKIDAFAPAIGNSHGISQNEPKLDLNLLKELNEKIDIPLVLHGGSGIDEEQIKATIDIGITKININTELQIVWSKEVRKFLDSNKDVYDPRKIILSGQDAMVDLIKKKTNLFSNKNIF